MTIVRRTKIVATLGPASTEPDRLDALVAAGVDVARLNFSHGTHAAHARVIERLRAGEARWGRPVAILQDLQGPKIRLGTFGPRGGRRVDLEVGREFTLVPGPAVGTAERASVSPAECLAGVTVGDQVWLDDGMIQLRAEAVGPDGVRCRIVAGGRVSDHKGVSFPHVPLGASCLTDKDRADLAFGVEQGVDFIAVSFVSSAGDIAEVRRLLAARGAEIPVVAKLERPEAIAHLGELLRVVDAVMVARGDLGVNVPLEEVPHIQKRVIREAHAARVPVIVATQMLESMVGHVRPTRAEVADVTAAILDGADAIMLSAETATGAFPVDAVQVMGRIAERAERVVPELLAGAPPRPDAGFTEAVAGAAVTAARALGARAIVAFTQSGLSARLLSVARPEVPIVALTPSAATRRRLALAWGVSSRLVHRVETTQAMIDTVEGALLGEGSVLAGDVLVIISGAPMWVAGSTNHLMLHRVGERR